MINVENRVAEISELIYFAAHPEETEGGKR
jgi:hypothetical protein